MNASGTSFDTESNHSCTEAELAVAPIPFGLLTSSTKDNLKSMLNLHMAEQKCTPNYSAMTRSHKKCDLLTRATRQRQTHGQSKSTNFVPMDVRSMLTPPGRTLKGSNSTVGGSSHKLQQYQPDTPMIVPTTSNNCKQHFDPRRNGKVENSNIQMVSCFCIA